MHKYKRKTLILMGISALVLAVLMLTVALNFALIKDVLTGMAYRPSAEMSEIRTSLDLTGKGSRIFNAVMPELMEKQDFNQNCRGRENENAILGCYRDDRVYVYNIVDEELPGIRELTSAHELLHAVYYRMSDSERQELAEILAQVYEENRDVLGEEIDLYSETDKKEEIYVRAGTEIASLPEVLEKHYAEIFKDQDKVVGFYDSYIKVFREIERKLDELYTKAQAKEAEINNKTATYEADVAALNKDIEEFNQCARTANCFTSQWAFNSRRQGLINRENALSAVYDEINRIISEYNALVTEYNENVLHGQILNMAINSSDKVEGI